MKDAGDISPPLARALSQRGYDTLTPVQVAMCDPALENSDLLVSSRTGSGKTVAFGLALAPTLIGADEKVAPGRIVRGLVVAPTRELALQVKTELDWLYADTGARIATCVGGMNMRSEMRALSAGADIVVGTPGRLRDHIERGSLRIDALRGAVLDEADEMLDLGFREDLEFILGAANPDRRTLLFSATMPHGVVSLAERFQRGAVRIATEDARTAHADIDYKIMPVQPNQRENAVINTLLHFDAERSIVFCGTREGVRHLASRLANRGFAVVALSGELSQDERTNALAAMRDGRARVCVATDVAARGIDLKNLDLVIHADLPSNPETLLHRSGRTGRAGRSGTCVVIAPQHRRGSAQRLLSRARVSASLMPPPTQESLLALERERLLGEVFPLAEPGTDEAETVAALVEQHSPEALAAAFLRLRAQNHPAPELVDAFVPPPPKASLGERPMARFESGVWFRLSIGRDRGADPRWLLPIICKAGGITRSQVGSIRILPEATLFEISGDAAEAYATAISGPSHLDRGVTIVRHDGDLFEDMDRRGPSRPARPAKSGRRPRKDLGHAGDAQGAKSKTHGPKAPRKKGQPFAAAKPGKRQGPKPTRHGP
ncbi:DEAD/DEAH box helicase [Hartmannibacter diazotrophicus]|nr:DEAD/DEAH box helicase [Hartmannibacter diazotrophicus]